jgi:hypothetical protein
LISADNLRDRETLVKKIVGLAIMLLAAPTFALTQSEMEERLAAMISIVQGEILEGKPFMVFGGDYIVLPKVIIEEKGQLFPNGNLSPIDEGLLGVLINRPFLNMRDDNAQLFALAHEMGHGFSHKLLADIDCNEASGVATEVVADLGAVKVLQSMGISFDVIDKTVANWRKSMIFDVTKKGDHPAGDDRYKFIHKLIVALKSGAEFKTSVRKIIREDLKATCLQ